MKKLIKKILEYFSFVLCIELMILIVISGNKRYSVTTTNTNIVKSIEAIHIVNKYESILSAKEDSIVIPVYENFDELVANGANGPVSFIGTITGYGPDCEGCGGRTGCPPRQDVRNGNIYYDDDEYGTIRIVATDKRIPCGSIVKISNYHFADEPIIAIALDRGGAIKNKTMDLLYNSEEETIPIGRQWDIKFDIIRWGW